MININKDPVQKLSDRIEAEQYLKLRAWARDLHTTDVAEILGQMRLDPASYLYCLLDPKVRADVLIELDEEIAGGVLGTLDSDDATDIVAELPSNKAEEFIGHLEDDERASDIRDLLAYQEGKAGAMMAKELVKVQANWAVTRTIREIRRQTEEVHQVYTVYVVDEEDQLTGRLSMKHLLLGAESTWSKVKELQREDGNVTIQAHKPSEKATILMERYDLVTLPVVDAKQRLLGRITIDDAVDSIIEDVEQDYQLASGISEDVESSDNVITLTRSQLPWLLIGLVGGIGGAYVIGWFDIKENAEMALFIPLIAAMGGNVGVQSAAIVVQGLASNYISTSNIIDRISKEFGVGILNGLICGLLILGITLPLNFGTALSITVSIALLYVIIFAALFHTFVPLMLHQYKIDPALATGPFITTVNDNIGLMIYFAVSSLISSLILG